MDGTTASPCLMEPPAALNHIISLGFSGDFKAFSSSLLHLGSYFHSFGHPVAGFDSIVLTKVIADIWQRDGIARKESDWARSTSSQTIRRV